MWKRTSINTHTLANKCITTNKKIYMIGKKKSVGSFIIVTGTHITIPHFLSPRGIHGRLYYMGCNYYYRDSFIMQIGKLILLCSFHYQRDSNDWAATSVTRANRYCWMDGWDARMNEWVDGIWMDSLIDGWVGKMDRWIEQYVDFFFFFLGDR